MSIASPIFSHPPALGPRRVSRPFSVAEYDEMIRLGWLEEDDLVELLEGAVVFKIPADPLHDATIERTTKSLLRRLGLGDDWSVRGQSGIETDDSCPEPDVTIAIGPSERYDARRPASDDLVLVIEVSNSSLEADRQDKGRVYARARIPVYWIINLVERIVEVYTDPTGEEQVPAYRSRTDFAPTESLPLMIRGRHVGDIPVVELIRERPGAVK